MKQLIFRLGVFLIPIGISCITLELLLRHIPTPHELKANYLKEQGATINTLILGTSHTFYGVNPEVIGDSVFNVANVSQTLDIDWKILEQYQPSLTALHTIVLCVSYSNLFERLQDGVEAWRIKNYRIYYGLSFDQSLRYHFELFSLHFKTNVRRLVDYYVFEKEVLYCNQFGWGTDFQTVSEVPLSASANAAVDRHSVNDLTTIETQLLTIKKVISFCKRQNVRLMLITPPTHKLYREQLNPLQLQAMQQAIGHLLSENTSIRYFNFSDHPDFDTADFYDADHLNAVGAEKFSRVLKSSINQQP